MTLGRRNASKHDTLGVQHATGYHNSPNEYEVGQEVVTIDGFPGKVIRVEDADLRGNENYHVELNDGLGGGEYSTSQLRPMTSSKTIEAVAGNLASDDYAELTEILVERPDIAINSRLGSLRVQAIDCPRCNDEIDQTTDSGELMCPTCGYNPDEQKGEHLREFNLPHEAIPYSLNSLKTAGMFYLPPKFEPGDRVIDFRGEPGTIHSVRDSGHPGKSNKVRVISDGETEPNMGEYNESVYDHHPDAPAEQIERSERRINDAKNAHDAIDSAFTSVDQMHGADAKWLLDNNPMGPSKYSSKVAGEQAPYDTSCDHCGKPGAERYLRIDHTGYPKVDWHCNDCKDKTEDQRFEDIMKNGARKIACAWCGCELGIESEHSKICPDCGKNVEEHQKTSAEDIDPLTKWLNESVNADREYMPHARVWNESYHKALENDDPAARQEAIDEANAEHDRHYKVYRSAQDKLRDDYHAAIGQWVDGQDGVTAAVKKKEGAYCPHCHYWGMSYVGGMDCPVCGFPMISGENPDDENNVANQVHDPSDFTEAEDNDSGDSDDSADSTGGGDSDGGGDGGGTTASLDVDHLLFTASSDTDFRFQLTAAWSDVRRKAKRIRSEGGVNITLSTEGMVVANVKGDTHVYETGLQRFPGKQSVSSWSCGCKWGAYHWGAPDDTSRFAGRMCSHALALQFEAQARGMFGKSVNEDDNKPSWVPKTVVVKWDIDQGKNMRARAKKAASSSEPATPTSRDEKNLNALSSSSPGFTDRADVDQEAVKKKVNNSFVFSIAPDKYTPSTNRRIPTDEITAQDIADHRKMLEDAGHLDDPDMYQGGWNENGKTDLDLSYASPSHEEAYKRGLENKQKAYYDVAQDKTMYYDKFRDDDYIKPESDSYDPNKYDERDAEPWAGPNTPERYKSYEHEHYCPNCDTDFEGNAKCPKCGTPRVTDNLPSAEGHSVAFELVRQGALDADMLLALGIDLTASTSSPWGEVIVNIKAKTPGATQPHSPNDNPGSMGWASAPDPQNWGFRNPSMNNAEGIGGVNGSLNDTLFGLENVKDEKDEEGTEATLRDPEHPEGALPATDGVTMPNGKSAWDDLGNDTELDPEFAPTGSLHHKVEDIVSEFQKNASHLITGSSGGMDNADIASAAKEHLEKTALKENWTVTEQKDIVDEQPFRDKKAANLDDLLDLKGTHYEDVEEALQKEEEEGHDELWSSF